MFDVTYIKHAPKVGHDFEHVQVAMGNSYANEEMPGLCTCGKSASTILAIFVISNQGLIYYNKFIVQIIPVDEAFEEIKCNQFIAK